MSKNNLPSIVTGLVLAVILVLYMVTFQVRFTEVAIVRTFGRASPESVIKDAGLYWKWPWPIQEVDVYDARVRLLETHTEQTATHDKKPVIVTTFMGWRINDPYAFRASLRGGETDAERRLREIVETRQKEVVGQYEFAQLVSKNASELKFDAIEKEIRDKVQENVAKEYGITIETFGIKRLALPEDVTQSVFESMKAERQALAQKYKSEGESERTNIISRANSQAVTILSFADRLAQKYRSEGNARAAEYFATLQKNESLAMFLDRLRKLKEILKDRTTIVLTWDQYPFTEFKDRGDLKASEKRLDQPASATLNVAPPGQVGK